MIKNIQLLIILTGLFGLRCAHAQHVVTGRVTDATTGDPVPFANVGLLGLPVGTVTDFDGNYRLDAKVLTDSLQISFLGYATKRKALDKTAASQEIRVQLAPSATLLGEVTVHVGENPAFPILRNVLKNRTRHDFRRLTQFEYDSYSKTELDVDNITERFQKRRVMRKIGEAVANAQKIAGEDGKPVLPVFVSEQLSRYYYQAAPERRKELIQHTNVKGVGVNNGSFAAQLIGSNSFRNWSFYDNALTFLTKDFASPIGANGLGVYTYYLADTTDVGDHVCYEIDFEPKRPQDLAFSGKMWIDTAQYALVRIDATIGADANLNFVKKVKIQQELAPADSTGKQTAWLPVRTRLLVDIAELTKNSAGMLAKFYVSNQHIALNRPHPTSFYDIPVEQVADARQTSDAFWANARPDSLTRDDRLARQLIDTVQNLPIVHTYVDIAQILTTGWKKYPGFDVGPYIYSVAVNRIEGLRLRLGFRTNEQFSNHWIFRGYVAYGTRDGRFKYSAEADYLFSRRNWTVAGVRVSDDLERVGLYATDVGTNKLFYAFTKWGRYRGGIRQQDMEVFAKTNLTKGISLRASLLSRDFTPLFPFSYRTQPELGTLSPVNSNFDNTQLDLELRFAHNETFIMDGNERITLGTRRTPVFTLRYTRGLRGVWGGEFDYHLFSARAYQTLRFGQVGRSNYTLSGGYTPSVVPALLLFSHLGNPTVLYNRNSFNLMNFFEYVSDRYVALQWQHQFDGFFFNRLPFVNKWHWRLVANANVLWGAQRTDNLALTEQTFLPGFKTRYQFGSLDPARPYVEVGYGIDNIFRFLQIVAFHRLTYRDPGVPVFGVKGSVHFSF